MKKVFKVVIWITLVITALVGLAALTAERCHETEIIDDVVSELILSPQRDKYLVIQGDLITLRDAKTDLVLAKTGRKNREREITWYHGWVNNDEFGIALIDKNKIYGTYTTSDFKNYKLLNEIKKDIAREYSKSFKRHIIQHENTRKIYVQYENYEKWDTGLAFPLKGGDWSNDDRYVFLTQDKDTQFLLDTKRKTSVKLREFSGEWAPTKDLFRAGFSIFNPKTLESTDLCIYGYNIDDYIWSPDSEHILLVGFDELYLSSVKDPSTPPKLL